MTIKELKDLPLHDQCFAGVEFDFETKNIKIKIGIFNEQKQDCDYFDIIFSGVFDLKMQEFIMMTLTDLEIGKHQVIDDNGNLSIKFILLLGYNSPTFEFSFGFIGFDMKPVS